MDVRASHFLRSDAPCVRGDRTRQFAKGIVIMELYKPIPASKTESNPEGIEDPTPVDHVQLGNLFVREVSVPTCHFCKQAGHLQKECPEKARFKKCRNCSNMGHDSKNCPKGKKCNHCLEFGHMKSSCPTRECLGCGQTGHLKKECPKVQCNKCGGQGHKAKDCTKRRRLRCSNCNAIDHSAMDCTKPCGACGEDTHRMESCHMPIPSSEQPSEPEASTAASAPVEVGAKVDTPSPNDQVSGGDDTHSMESCDMPIPSSEQPSQPEAPAEASAPAEAGAKADTPSPNDQVSGGDVVDSDMVDADDGDDGGLSLKPLGRVNLPAGEELAVKLFTDLIPEHASSVSLTFKATYQHDEAVNGLRHTEATVRFTHRNINKDSLTITTESLAEDSTTPGTAAMLLDDEGRAKLAALAAGGDAMSTQPIQHIAFDVNTSISLGECFYADGDFGPFTEPMRKARDMLLQSGRVRVHFITLGADCETSRVEELAASIEKQRVYDPILYWYPNGKVNPQRGMGLPADERPAYELAPRFQFDSSTEYLTILFYSSLATLEANSENPRLKTTIRLVRFPSGGDRVYLAAIERVEGLSLRADAVVHISFLGEDGDIESDWTARMLGPLPFVTGVDAAAFLLRPRNGLEFDDSIKFDRDSVLDSTTFNTAGDLANALHAAKGTEVWVREQITTACAKGELNTIRYLSQHMESYGKEMDVLLANNTISLPIVDYFAADIRQFGAERVHLARTVIEEALVGQQRAAWDKLAHMKGSFHTIQGTAGTGKSTMIEQIIRYHYRLCSVDGLAPRCWVLSPLNGQLDDLAERTFQTLLREYKDGRSQKYPIVVRRHMQATEKRVYMRHADEKREQQGINQLPLYFIPKPATLDDDYKDKGEEDNNVEGEEDNNVKGEEDNNVESEEDSDVESEEDIDAESGEDNNVKGEEDNNVESEEDNNVESEEDNNVESEEDNNVESEEDSDVESEEFLDAESGEDSLHAELNVALIIHRAWTSSDDNGFDRRLKRIEFSEATWVLRLAGVPDGDGALHPIADPSKYQRFRTLLDKHAAGQLQKSEDRSQLTTAANEVMRDLALITDATFMTPHVASQARSYNRTSPPRCVIHDEAGKMTEVAALSGIVWSKVGSEGGAQIPQLLFGDVFQPRPAMDSKSQACFHPQRPVSLFARLVLAGHDVTWLQHQHRYVAPIAALINDVVGHGTVTTSIAVGERDISANAQMVMKHLFDVDEPLVLLATNSKAHINLVSHSISNGTHVSRCIWVVVSLLSEGVQAADIGIGVFYTAQLALYTAALRALEEWCGTQEDSKYHLLADQIHKVQLFTFDGKQGGEIEYLVMDTCIAGPLGFIRDMARMHLGLSRARACLIIIANPLAVEGAYANGPGGCNSLLHSAYYRVVQWFKRRGLYINLQRKGLGYEKIRAPFNINDVIDRSQRRREFDAEPYRHGIQRDYTIGGADFGDLGSDEKEDGDNGDGADPTGGWDKVDGADPKGGWNNGGENGTAGGDLVQDPTQTNSENVW